MSMYEYAKINATYSTVSMINTKTILSMQVDD